MKINGTRDIAQRMVNAENGFIAVLMKSATISQAQAEKVMQVYRKAKVLKMDAVGGHMTVKHGAFLDRDVILRALEA